MTKSRSKQIAGMTLAALMGLLGTAASAATTLERVKAGEVLRIGYSNEAPYAFQNDKGEIDGFVNQVALAVLESMGVTNTEGVLTEWGSLIPGLNAGRFDVITAGMYILPKRCEQVAFTEPLAELGEAFLVPKGNPKNIHSFEDLRDQGGVLATVAGYATVQWAKDLGIAEDRIMQVGDTAAMLQAVKGGRADVASATIFVIADLVEKGGGDVEMASPFSPPEFTKGWIAYAFRKDDADFLKAFNEAQAAFVGSDRFWEIVRPYGFTDDQIPEASVTAASRCAN